MMTTTGIHITSYKYNRISMMIPTSLLSLEILNVDLGACYKCVAHKNFWSYVNTFRISGIKNVWPLKRRALRPSRYKHVCTFKLFISFEMSQERKTFDKMCN